MKIIDFEQKGNSVRFYLGKDDCKDYIGDDWNDRPYEHNAGRVYDEYIEGHYDIVFPFDCIVIEPREGQINSPWCKDDMKERKVPCLIVVDEKQAKKDGWWHNDDFVYWVGTDIPGVHKIYFGDSVEKLKELAAKLGFELDYGK